MVITVVNNLGRYERLCLDSVNDAQLGEYHDDDRYYPYKDNKWKEFCKEHNFSTNTHGKVYELYLRMCAEGMI